MLDSAVDNAFACHLCGPGSNTGRTCGSLVVARPDSVVSPGSPVFYTTFDHIKPTSAPSRKCLQV